MGMNSARSSMGRSHQQTGRDTAGSDGAGRRVARHATPALVAVTLGIVLTGGIVAVRAVADTAGPATDFTDGRVSTSFGALWVDSFEEVVVPQMAKMGHMNIPLMGDPDKLWVQVVVRLANTTAAPVELTRADFSLRGSDNKPASVDLATFESVKLLPGALLNAKLQFSVKEGEHHLSLLFDDPGSSGPIAIDLGRMRLEKPAGGNDGKRHE